MMKVYFAGPDVFKADYDEITESIREICEKYEIEPIFPIEENAEKVMISANPIFLSNLHKIELADAVILNMEAFRSPDMDPGTAFEAGYAYALGKPVFGINGDTLTIRLRMQNSGYEIQHLDGKYVDEAGCFIEDFNLPCNLMIACACEQIATNLEGAIEMVVQHRKSKPGISRLP